MSTYIPILAAERSRFDGLAATTDAVKDQLTPLFDVASMEAATWDGAHRDDAAPDGGSGTARAVRRLVSRADRTEARLTALVDAMGAAFGTRLALLDCPGGERYRAADGRVYAAWLLDEARGRGLSLVPVTGLRRPDAHQLAVADAASVDRRGVCLRLQLPDFSDLDALAPRVHALLDALGAAPDQMDVMLDFGRVAVEHLSVLAVAARAVLRPLERAARWRSVALAAAGHASRPAADGVAAGRTPPAGAPAAVVPRTEWLLWRALAADAARAQALGFGDYGGLCGGSGGPEAPASPVTHAPVTHAPVTPAPAAPAPRTDAPRPERAPDVGDWLGYAHDAEWLVLQAPNGVAGGWHAGAGGGRRAGDGRLPPLDALPGRPEFYGVAHCAGDARLAAARPAPGGAPAEERAALLAGWRAAALTHHLTVTVEQLARAARVAG